MLHAGGPWSGKNTRSSRIVNNLGAKAARSRVWNQRAQAKATVPLRGESFWKPLDTWAQDRLRFE